MPRVKRGVTSHRRHKKVLKAAKGYYGARSRVFRVAKQAVTKAGQYAYRDRKVKKRMFRGLWIQRINAAAREHGLSYSRLINGLKKSNIDIDRRVLAELALNEEAAFAALAEKAKEALAAAYCLNAPLCILTGANHVGYRKTSGQRAYFDRSGGLDG